MKYINSLVKTRIVEMGKEGTHNRYKQTKNLLIFLSNDFLNELGIKL